MARSFIRIRPRSDQLYVSQGRMVMATNPDGFIDGLSQEGLFVHETRLLSKHRATVAGERPRPGALSKVEQHSWMGYYVVAPPGLEVEEADMGSGVMEEVSEQTIELRISRFAGSNLHEDLDVANFSSDPVEFELAIELDADFADQIETYRPRRQYGELRQHWERVEKGRWALRFRYAASRGDVELRRGLDVFIHRCDSPPRWEEGRLVFDVSLQPHQRWHSCVDYVPVMEEALDPPGGRTYYQCRSFEPTDNPMDRRRRAFLESTPNVGTGRRSRLASVVERTYNRSIEDLASLRLPDLDVDETSWTMAAGLPLYVALFGRDTLTAAWQAAMVDTGMLRGTLVRIAEKQGERVDDWRDEQPGRMLHEAHTGPLEVLEYNPRARYYYGSITTSAMFPVTLCQLWHWSGDKDVVRPFIEPALRALDWLDRHGDLDGDGLYEYKTRSSQGTKHQAWKDSDTAMVYEDGTVAEPPIATCEEQGFAYMAKFLMSELLWSFGRRDTARKLWHEAAELKKRFRDAFWMSDEAFLAMALDSDKRSLRSIGSNAGHCVATGIVDQSMAGPICGRLLSEELFSGWGVRTLSSEHPAYNPFSYHRGSIWPVENGTFALGFLRYGLPEHVAALSEAMFETAELFESLRLPEVFSGHQRNADHPFPAFYPQSNSPQAWYVVGDLQPHSGHVWALSLRAAEYASGQSPSSRMAPGADHRRSPGGAELHDDPVFPPRRRHFGLPRSEKGRAAAHRQSAQPLVADGDGWRAPQGCLRQSSSPPLRTAAAYHGVVGLTETLQMELDDTDIDVCLVLPGSMATPLHTEHARSKTGRTSRAMPPVAHPKRVANKLIRCLRRPRRVVRPDLHAKLLAAADRFGTGLLRRFLTRFGERLQMTRHPEPVRGHDNLDAPMDGGRSLTVTGGASTSM